MAGQKLRGFVGQGMDARKKAFVPFTHPYPPGSYTWTCPATGYYLLTNWGSGGSTGAGPGASGGFTQSLVLFAKGETVAVIVSTTSGVASTFTFKGRTVTAGGALGNAPGTASGGDRNLNGSAGGSGSPASNGLGNSGGTAAPGATGGAGSPGEGTYRGADGGTSGPGAGSSNGSVIYGYGYAIIVRQPNAMRT